jgi:hypothetical protein
MAVDPIEIVRTLSEQASQSPRHFYSAIVDLNDGVARVLSFPSEILGFRTTRGTESLGNLIAMLSCSCTKGCGETSVGLLTLSA